MLFLSLLFCNPHHVFPGGRHAIDIYFFYITIALHVPWSAAFVYGLEFSRTDIPVFVAFSLPIHDKAGGANPEDEYDESPMKEWNAPDWSDFGQQWTIAVGIKGSFF